MNKKTDFIYKDRPTAQCMLLVALSYAIQCDVGIGGVSVRPSVRSSPAV